MKRFVGFVTAAVLGFLSSFTFAYSGGTGSSDEPYQIGSVADWQTLMSTSADWNQSFILTSDLDLQGIAVTPVGNSSQMFTGIFDGNSHIIRNAVINTPSNSYVAIFGSVGPGGEIRSLGVESVNFSGNSFVGGLIGKNDQGAVNSCYVTGVVRGFQNIGGLIGWNSGDTSFSFSSDSVTGNTSGSYIGGLIGSNSGTISYCYSIGAITGYANTSYIGGLIGSNSGTVSSCYSTGAIIGYGDAQYIGGLIGCNTRTVKTCYAAGSITGTYDVGGLIGYNYFPTNGTDTSCVWDMNTTGKTLSIGGKGLTTAQMKTMSIFQNAGWADQGWILDDGNDYPRLAWQGTAGTAIPQAQPVPLMGSGTAEDPYQIWTADDFALLSWHSSILDQHIILMANLDLSGVTIFPIGDLGRFTGVFDGNAHLIHNAVIDMHTNSFVGLFGRIGQNGQICNLGLESVNISGKECVGGLVGFNHSGTVSGCYTTGTIIGSKYVGGLIGCNVQKNVMNCYSSANVYSGTNMVGGLIGSHSSSSLIRNCYSTGKVFGTSSAGLTGSSTQPSAGCFWDINTSNQTTSASGKGLTTSQMKTMSIFQNAGWGDNSWVIEDGADYPRLAWQTASGTPIPPPISPLEGSGTEADPYQIKTANDFALLSWHTLILDKHLILVNDLDLSGVPLCPIGDLGLFTGIFDGNGHVIRKALINLPSNNRVGLFGSIGTGAEIRNLEVGLISITGQKYVGGIVGDNDSGKIRNCHITGTVSGSEYIGGLAGNTISASIHDCDVNMTVNGGGFVGGLMGITESSMISNCHSFGTVYNNVGWLYCGGLIGFLSDSTVIDCHSEATVNVMYQTAGGLIGLMSSGSLKRCYASGSVIAVAGKNPRYLGGLVGKNYSGTLTDCYAQGGVSGSTYLGGLIGSDSEGVISNCYSMGQISGTSSKGGLIGTSSSGVYQNCFWDTQTSGQATSAGGSGVVGKTTAEMKTLSTFTSAGWDFTNESVNGTEEIWRLCADVDYPKLNWQSATGDFLCPDGLDDEDLNLLRFSWLSQTGSPAWDSRCDLNGDGKINSLDLLLFRKACAKQP